MESRTASTAAPASDLELVNQYKVTRDRALLGALFERYSHLALGLSLRYLHNREDAEEVPLDLHRGTVNSVDQGAHLNSPDANRTVSCTPQLGHCGVCTGSTT